MNDKQRHRRLDRVTVYTPDSSLAQPAKMLRDMLGDLVRGRELALRLAIRDVKAQYRQAILGFLWAFIIPLAHTVTWIFLNSSGIVSVGDTGMPYPVYALTGTMLWAILMDAVNAPLQHTNQNREMLTKLNFPREAILVSGIYQTLFNASIKVVLVLVALLIFGIVPGWSLLLFPLGIFSLILVGTAIGLLLTPVGLLYTDIGRAVPLLLQFLMYFSPVLYPMPNEGFAATLFSLNPLSPLIMTARDWITGASPEHLGGFLIVSAVAGATLLLVWIAYRLAMPIVIERMSA